MLIAILAALAAVPAPLYVVTATGVRVRDTSGTETTAYCRRFRLTAADARRYFALAERVSEREYVHDLEMSQCRTLGIVRGGASRDRARWSIDRERRGLIVDAAGRSTFYYCRRCTNPAFEPVYDPDAE